MKLDLAEVISKVEEIKSGNYDSISMMVYSDLSAKIKAIKDLMEDTTIELEVDDFLENGAGRSREGAYDS